ncbi:MAG TPA: helix-turn-helix domain-containing protein [Micromonosporaceae bacterium]
MSVVPPAGDPDGFGALLLRARRARGRSQDRLARQLCAAAGVDTVSRHEISRWEREERIPTPYWVDWLSVVLGIDAADLERAIAHTRSRRAAPVAPRWPAASAWPWRVLAARSVTDARGGITVRIEPHRSPRSPTVADVHHRAG